MCPCHRCEVPKERLHNNFSYYSRSSPRTSSLRKIYVRNRRPSKMFEESMRKLSMTTVLPVMSDLSLVGIHFCAYIYVTFRIQPMQVLSHGAGKMIKTCEVHILCNGMRPTLALSITSHVKKKSRHLINIVIKSTNKFVGSTDQLSSGQGLELDYSK